MSDDERTRRGIERSLRIYYDDQRDTAAMDRLYARFVKPGDLVFDVGSHVGDRIAAFRRLGARVVACEPNPALVPTLRRLYGRDDKVTLEPVAVGAKAGEIELQDQRRQPDRLDRLGGFREGVRRRARLGRPDTGTRASRCR